MDTMTVIKAILMTMVLGGFVLLRIVWTKVGDDDQHQDRYDHECYVHAPPPSRARPRRRRRLRAPSVPDDLAVVILADLVPEDHQGD